MQLPNLEQRLHFSCVNKPLLVGGMAMEFYELRKSGDDIDFVISKTDHQRLIEYVKKDLVIKEGTATKEYKKTPEFVDLYGDKGVLIYEFEIWNQILKYDYTYLSEHAIEREHCLIISLEKLLLLKALGMDKKKYRKDVELIVQKILHKKYD